jgi:hypothetical protein
MCFHRLVALDVTLASAQKGLECGRSGFDYPDLFREGISRLVFGRGQPLPSLPEPWGKRRELGRKVEATLPLLDVPAIHLAFRASASGAKCTTEREYGLPHFLLSSSM